VKKCPYLKLSPFGNPIFTLAAEMFGVGDFWLEIRIGDFEKLSFFESVFSKFF
jgi:hypothetical protein